MSVLLDCNINILNLINLSLQEMCWIRGVVGVDCTMLRCVCVCYSLFVCLPLFSPASKGQRSILVFPITTVWLLRVPSATLCTNIWCYVHNMHPAVRQWCRTTQAEINFIRARLQFQPSSWTETSNSPVRLPALCCCRFYWNSMKLQMLWVDVCGDLFDSLTVDKPQPQQ